MDLFEQYGQLDQKNELRLKEKYDNIVATGVFGYNLVSLSLKRFNKFSHKIGREKSDEVIRHYFHLLASCLKEDEYIARLGYAHFNLLIKCKMEEAALIERVHEIHFKIRDAMEEAYGWKQYSTIGFYPIGMKNPERDFYEAQYLADLCSTDNEKYKYFETNFDMYYMSYVNQDETFSLLEQKIQSALDCGDFKLYLQPKVCLATGEVDSAEVLMRWVDPDMGMIPLNDFLPSMEEYGHIRKVDLYLFGKACSNLETWLHTYGKKINLSFNLSKAYFEDHYFMEEYTTVFSKYDIPAECIRIELLESIVLNDIDYLKPLVDKIYEFGFSCALDDFGSGFSSFDILTNVTLSELKIDRSLFLNAGGPREHSLIRHIVEIAHDLGLVTVAEGIETKDYADYLKEIGCDFIQGYYYYKPMPVEEFEKLFIVEDTEEIR